MPSVVLLSTPSGSVDHVANLETTMKAFGTLLLDHRCWNERPSADGPGVYANFLTQADALAPIRTELSEAIYVGMTDGSLDARCHFDHPHSGTSTLRRSIGAILKGPLALCAI